jgi:hypothetical protein
MNRSSYSITAMAEADNASTSVVHPWPLGGVGETYNVSLRVWAYEVGMRAMTVRPNVTCD